MRHFLMNEVQNQTFIQSSVSYGPNTNAIMNAKSNHFKEKRPNCEVLNSIFEILEIAYVTYLIWL